MKIKDFEQKTQDALLTCFQDTPVAAPRKTSPRYLNPIRTGGVEELILSASGFSVLDPNLLEKILETYDMRKLWAATGWFLEHFHVPAEVIEGFANKPPSPLFI
ncbi:MAG: hypothetical protein R6U51_04940 [Anaerolineales bacterium]